MARLEIGEVLLTTSMSDVFLRLRQPVLAGDVTLAEQAQTRVLTPVLKRFDPGFCAEASD